jgi:hypothetical protein
MDNYFALSNESIDKWKAKNQADPKELTLWDQ